MKMLFRQDGVGNARRLATCLGAAILALSLGGCYAPLRSYGIKACTLPEEYRLPYRTAGMPMNFVQLTAPAPADYLLGPGDVLAIAIPGLYDKAETSPLSAQVMSNGEIFLPLLGAINVDRMNMVQAQQAITAAYANGILKNPRVNLTLAAKATVSVVVLGNVKQPGVILLPKFENDVAHALAAAQGLTENAADYLEVHRRRAVVAVPIAEPLNRIPPMQGEAVLPAPLGNPMAVNGNTQEIITIPLYGPETRLIDPSEVVLESGDVIVVPQRKQEVFYVVGKLKETGQVRFTVNEKDRELGVGFILPRDREIDVVTAVAMAGYIDPIDSPTTVTVQRYHLNGEPQLILVDLIAARSNRLENILVEAGDIIYLNPDGKWWFRRTLDRVVPDLITIPYLDIFFD